MNFQIELTSHCNLSCVECPHRKMERHRSHIRRPVVDVICDKYIKRHKPGTVILHKDGEPLLHPEFREIVGRIAEATTAKLDIYTNGLLLTAELVHYLSQLPNKVWILISFHFYNANGKRTDYDAVEKELIRCFALNAKNVEFVLASHVTDMVTEDELKAWQRHWLKIGDRYEQLRAVHVNTAINPWTGLIEQKNAITFPSCPYMDGQHYFIGVTGNVIACCMDLEEEIVFGNVMEDEPEVIEKKRTRFYQIMQERGAKEDVCHRCLGKKD